MRARAIYLVGRRAKKGLIKAVCRNGKSGYAFLLTTVDGDLNGTADAFRLKVTDNKGKVVFDNQLGQPDTAVPQTISSGKVVVSAK